MLSMKISCPCNPLWQTNCCHAACTDPAHAQLVASISKMRATLPGPYKAILVCTAHWEEKQATVSSNKAPDMLYDYGGFPPEAYKLKYSAPGSPELALRVQELLRYTAWTVCGNCTIRLLLLLCPPVVPSGPGLARNATYL